MTNKLVTCPETGHLERLELEATDDGIVIESCSRYPGGEPACERECARRMDRRARSEFHVPEHERVLVLIDRHDDIPALAQGLAASLRADQLDVEVVDVGVPAVPPPQDYDAVVIGCARRYGSGVRSLIAYLREHDAALAAIPTFFFGDNGLERMTLATGWQPQSALVAPRIPPDLLRRFALHVAEEIPGR